MNYYLIGIENKAEMASAYAPENTKLAHELAFDIDGKELPFPLTLVKVSISKSIIIESNYLRSLDNPWLDYQPNSLAWPLLSAKLKNIIQNNLTGNEGVEWIRAKVHFGQEQKDYFIPTFSRKMDVLNQKETKYVPGTDQIIKPVFSSAKISKYSLFHKPSFLWKITNEIYINENIKNIIEGSNITGVNFEKTSVK